MSVLLRTWSSQQGFYNSCMTETAKLQPFCLGCQSRCIAFLKRTLQELLCLTEKSLLLHNSLLPFSKVCYCCATEKDTGNTDTTASLFSGALLSKSVLCCRSSFQFFLFDQIINYQFVLSKAVNKVYAPFNQFSCWMFPSSLSDRFPYKGFFPQMIYFTLVPQNDYEV